MGFPVAQGRAAAGIVIGPDGEPDYTLLGHVTPEVTAAAHEWTGRLLTLADRGTRTA